MSVLSMASVVFLQSVVVQRAEATPQGALLRFHDAAAQLRAQALVDDQLNPLGKDRQFVVALNLAPNTPQWLRDIGAKPMTLGTTAW